MKPDPDHFLRTIYGFIALALVVFVVCIANLVMMHPVAGASVVGGILFIYGFGALVGHRLGF